MTDKYKQCLDYFTDFASDLSMPDLSMVKVMFMHKKQAALAEAARLARVQGEHELSAREAYTRLTLYTQANQFTGE